MCKIGIRVWEASKGEKLYLIKKDREQLKLLDGLVLPEIYLTRNKIKFLKMLEPNKKVNQQDIDYKLKIGYSQVIKYRKQLTKLGLITSKKVVVGTGRERRIKITEKGIELREKWLIIYRHIQDKENKN